MKTPGSSTIEGLRSPISVMEFVGRNIYKNGSWRMTDIEEVLDVIEKMVHDFFHKAGPPIKRDRLCIITSPSMWELIKVKAVDSNGRPICLQHDESFRGIAVICDKRFIVPGGGRLSLVLCEKKGHDFLLENSAGVLY